MAKQSDGRIFVKKVGGEERVRVVHTASDEVHARFEGFTERKSPVKSSVGGTPSSSSSVKPAGGSSS